MRGPVDVRLWRYCAPVRGYLVATVGLSLLSSMSVLAAGLLLSRIVAGVVTDPGRRALTSWTAEIAGLSLAFLVRAGTAWVQAHYGERAAGRAIATLNRDVLTAAVRRDPREISSRQAQLAPLLVRGTADLRPYLTGYLPALFLAVMVPPLVLATIATQDLISAAIVATTLPLIPVFMILIGRLTRGRSARTLAAMTRLSAQTLDLLAGLPTLRALGREQGPRARVRELGEAHRGETMSALRFAFLSAFVLELLATLSVALVAVSIGLRLVFGEMALQAGLAALILAPEAYHPLRQLGERFHAAEDGMAAADAAFAELADPAGIPQAGTARPARATEIRFSAVSVTARAGSAPSGLDTSFLPGEITVLAGPNGSGKTTALHLIMGLTVPTSGRVTAGGLPIAALDQQWWWQQTGWLPQHPVLLPGTLRDNLELTGAGLAGIESISAATGFSEVVAASRQGWETVIGAGGTGLSLGERQRLALTRVLATPKPVLLLDEPTAHLDAAAESRVLALLRERARAGATVIVVAHRPTLISFADKVIEVRSGD